MDRWYIPANRMIAPSRIRDHIEREQHLKPWVGNYPPVRPIKKSFFFSPAMEDGYNFRCLVAGEWPWGTERVKKLAATAKKMLPKGKGNVYRETTLSYHGQHVTHQGYIDYETEEYIYKCRMPSDLSKNNYWRQWAMMGWIAMQAANKEIIHIVAEKHIYFMTFDEILDRIKKEWTPKQNLDKNMRKAVKEIKWLKKTNLKRRGLSS